MQSHEFVGEIYNTYWPPEPDFAAEEICFFRTRLNLPRGDFAALVQLQLPDGRPQASVRLRASDAFDGTRLGELALEARADDIEALDDFILTFRVERQTVVEFVGIAAGLRDAPMVRYLRLLRCEAPAWPTRSAFRDDRFPLRTNRLCSILIGSTNICNASCPHCPANKPMLAGVPTGTMSMAMFERLLDGLDDIAIEDRFWFGVFGEPLADGGLEAKLELLRRRRPDAYIGVSTNAGAIDLARTEQIFAAVTKLQIHVEAVTPARYDALMHPLRAADVLPKVDALVEAYPDRVSIIAPFHRGNLTEAEALRERWSEKGVAIDFAPFHNRSASRTGANKLALWPTPGFWLADLVDTLTVDWDGTVLAICDDFLRRQPLGSLAQQSLPEIMAGEPRRSLHENLSAYRWARLPSLRDARMDSWAKVKKQTESAAKLAPRKWRLGAEAFSTRSDVRFLDGRLAIDPPAPGTAAAPVIYGPYLRLPEGRYSVELHVRIEEGEPKRFTSEALAYGHKIYQKREAPRDGGPVRLTFDHDEPDMPLEFRIFVEDFAERVTLTFSGATLLRVN